MQLFHLRLPSPRTRTRPLSMTVGIRCATVSTVHLLVSALIVFWIKSSVAVSTEAVASSSTKILLFCNNALARHTSCLCPTLQFSPSSATVSIAKFNKFSKIEWYIFKLFQDHLPSFFVVCLCPYELAHFCLL